jgi:prepilin-type processing-associated H-X9-DG protein
MERTRVTFPRSGVAGRSRNAGLTLTFVLSWIAAAQTGTARGQEPLARPAAGAAQASLARYVPKQDNLFFFFEFDGLDAHQAAWKNSAAYRLLNDTRLGALVEDLAGQTIEAMQQSAPADKQVKPAELIGLFKLAAKQGFAAGFWGSNPVDGGFVLVARGAARPEVIRLLESAAPGVPDAAPVPKAGRTLHAFDTQASWWVEKGDLVLSSKPDLVISTLDGAAPSMADHPLRTALSKKSDGFEPVAVGFFDVTAMPPMPPQAVQLGFDGLKRVEIQWGIQDDAMLAVVGLVAPQPRRGVLTLLDQPTFTVKTLPPLPAGLSTFLVLSLDPGKLYDQIVALARLTNPQGGDGFAQLELALRQRFGFDLRKDILAQLGPKIALYSQAQGAGAVGNPAAMLGQLAGLTIAVQARDEALAQNLDKLVQAINLIIQSQQAAARRGQPDPNAGVIAFRKQEAKRPTYVLDLPRGGLPPQMLAMFRPSIELGDGQLVTAATTTVADQAVDLGGLPADRLWRPTPAFVPMARRLPRDMVLLTVSDPRDTLPGFIEQLPIIIQQMNMLFPAVHSAREAARRAQCTNNFRQIDLALLQYVNVHNQFPGPAIIGKDGKPTLSWRVAILPYLDQQALYDRFHLDEPWFSPHNKALIKEMPQVFVCPGRTAVASGTTTYRVFTGPGTLFEAGKRTSLTSIRDGASNTILVVESREAVPWTKPDSNLPFDPAAEPSLYGAGSPHPGGFLAGFANGAIHNIGDTIDPKVFRSLITCNGREIVGRDGIPEPAREQPNRLDGPLHVDPAMLPRATELRPLLFPASLAITSNREGVRIVSREPIPSMSSPAASGVLIALLLPAVQSAREAARRAQCVNNLKQVALAMHNYHDTNGHFPRAVVGKDGKRLLSWRVAILPYIEQQELYNKFDLDEPWDSPHNKELIDEMPAIYACPSRVMQPGMTVYRGFVGKGAFFEKDQGTGVANITDGTSNTLMVVEASEAVPWTSPDSDLPFDPEAKPSLYGAGSLHPGGFNAAMADGSVRFFKNTISVITFKALITKAGGEVVQGGAF